MDFWGKKTFCVIAGASRGIGQAISQVFARKVGKNSTFLLLSRSEGALERTKASILGDPSSNCKDVWVKSIDLSNPDGEAFEKIISGAWNREYEHSILVQCAASLGIEKGLRVDELNDLGFIRSYLDFNVASFILLNSVFCKVVGAEKDKRRQTTIVHISSHGALEPYKTWGIYCAARAAKDMLLKSIALESPHIQTINYAPGVVDTENYQEALRDTKDPELVKAFEEEKEKGRLLTPMQTAEKLVSILGSKKYIKGEHVSYDEH